MSTNMRDLSIRLVPKSPNVAIEANIFAVPPTLAAKISPAINNLRLPCLSVGFALRHVHIPDVGIEYRFKELNLQLIAEGSEHYLGTAAFPRVFTRIITAINAGANTAAAVLEELDGARTPRGDLEAVSNCYLRLLSWLVRVRLWIVVNEEEVPWRSQTFVDTLRLEPGCCFELIGANASQILMPSGSIVEAIDVVGDVFSRLLACVVDAFFDALLATSRAHLVPALCPPESRDDL